jgi:hypothetical protein
MEENESKYKQTQQSPSMQEPLVSDIGYLGMTEECEKILEGTYTIPEGVNQYTRELPEHMKQLPLYHHNPPSKAEISTKTFKEG